MVRLDTDQEKDTRKFYILLTLTVPWTEHRMPCRATQGKHGWVARQRERV